MKLSFALLLLYFPLFAQKSELLLFPEKIHDFGEIAESGGKVEFEFRFVNNTARPILILSVEASCGCTTTGYTKEVIKQGGSGFVKASFDPKGRPGYFNKPITVTTDYNAETIILQIKGQVSTESEKDPMVELSAKNGSFRLKHSNFNFGKAYVNKDAIEKDFAVFNAGDKPIHILKKTIQAPYIIVNLPEVLMPKEKAHIKIIYDARLRSQYGFVSDNLELETDDELQPMKNFSIYATTEDFFPPLSEAELLKSPLLQLDNYIVAFGRMPQRAEVVKQVTVTNGGKTNLLIRSIQPNCTCVASSAEKLIVKPGETSTVKIVFNPMGRNGGQNKSITVYSNDPRNPVQRINITGYIPN